MQLSCVINRTASRSIMAGASSLVDSTNVMLADTCTSEQCEEILVANSDQRRRININFYWDRIWNCLWLIKSICGFKSS